MACLGTDRPADMHQSPPIRPTDAPGAPTGQGAGGWPPSGRCGTQARRPPGLEACLWGRGSISPPLDMAPSASLCPSREATSLRPRGFAKPEVAYCANGSAGAQEKQRGSQECPSRDKAPGVSTVGFSQRNLNAQSTLCQWAVGVCSLGVARAHGGAQAQSIALLAH